MVSMGVTKLINADIKGFVYCNPKKPVQTAAKIITDINTIGITIFLKWKYPFWGTREGFDNTKTTTDKKTTSSWIVTEIIAGIACFKLYQWSKLLF